MGSERMTIGLCLTRLADEANSLLAGYLREQCAAAGARLIVFNSLRDLFYGDEYDRGAAAVFDLVDPKLFDALVIEDEGFFDKQTLQGLINRAQQQNVPVITLYGTYKGCFSIQKYYDSVFAQLIRHVINDHNAKKLRLIAGNRAAAHTVRREHIFREAMLSQGLVCSQDDVAYCDDWAGPVQDTVSQWCADKDLPDAIICVSDVMARAVSDTLSENNVRVPEDVIVTGFDGLPSVLDDLPGLTTCVRDLKGTAACIMHMVKDAVLRHSAPYSAPERYTLRLSMTCGCNQVMPHNDHTTLRDFHTFLDTEIYRTEEAFDWTDRILAAKTVEDFNYQVCRNLPQRSMLALFDEQSTACENANAYFPLTEKKERPDGFKAAKLHPVLEDALKPGEMMVVQSIHVGETPVGYLTMIFGGVRGDALYLARTCRALDLVFSSITMRRQHERMADRLMNMRMQDTMTGLMNLNGLNVHLAKNYTELSNRCIGITIYEISTFEKIREEHGIDAADQMAENTARFLQWANQGDLVARIAGKTFMVLSFDDTCEALDQRIARQIADFVRRIEEYNLNRRDAPEMEKISSGTVVLASGWKNDLPKFIKEATGDMYLNRMKQHASGTGKKLDPAVDDKTRLEMLLNDNLFRYFFQPIVDAASGRIVAYEALMRTKDPVLMPPMDVLSIASRQNRLYAIERATIFNIMDFIEHHQEDFAGRGIFINTIPGAFLNEEDRSLLKSRYGHLLPQCTFEITEMNDLDDCELEQLRDYGDGETRCKLAIDDFGTGFSNIVNLLRYRPDLVKIDRYLISNVHLDVNKQHFIRNTVEFARMNDILVLAEGVETREELSKVIELGVDLIQGFYTACPSPKIIQKIPEEICHFMMEETLRFSAGNAPEIMYSPVDGESIELTELAVQKYPGILFCDGSYTLNGVEGYSMNVSMITAENAHVRLILNDVCIRAVAAAVTMGHGSTLELVVRGKCEFNYQGICVPQDANLLITGDGMLLIRNDQKFGFALGGSINDRCGGITVDMTGGLKVVSSAENALCIGAGRGTGAIRLLSGQIELEARGVRTIAVGSADGRTDVTVGEKAVLTVNCVGNEAVGIGALNGESSVEIAGQAAMLVEGAHITGIGSMNESKSTVKIGAVSLDLTMRGERAVGIGCEANEAQVGISGGLINIHMEGAQTCVIGSKSGLGTARITGGDLQISALTGNLYRTDGQLIMTGGSLMLTRDAVGLIPSGPQGEVLAATKVNAPLFEKMVRTEGSEYLYRAECMTDRQELCVWLPESDK